MGNIDIKSVIVTVAVIAFSVTVQSQTVTLECEQKADSLVSLMTLDEKISYIGGYNTFYIRAIPRLGIPEIRMADGPQGIRNDTKSTLYPCGILSASTWNRKLLYELGESLGRDARARGVHFLLGPGVNIYRSPLCGRNFEYFGEDPYLSGETAVNYIRGVQSQGVYATVKHFAGNNQEWDRNFVSTDIDDRTLHEIYLEPFRKAVVEGEVGAIMNSYNPLNGVHTTENKNLNIDVLRNMWGFKGILMSDWNSVYSTVGALNGGLDIEMPDGKYMNSKDVKKALLNGLINEKTIDIKVKHILQTLIAFDMLEREQKVDSIALDNKASAKTALNLAREGIVMLKNENKVLPLKGKTLLAGPNAAKIPIGGGSGAVIPYYTRSVYNEMKEKRNIQYGAGLSLYRTVEMNELHASDKKNGFNVEFFNNRELKGNPIVSSLVEKIDFKWDASPYDGVNKDNFSSIWTTKYIPSDDAQVRFTIAGDDGYRLYINDSLLVNVWHDRMSATMRTIEYGVKAGNEYHIRIEHYEGVAEAAIHFSMEIKDIEHLRKELKNAVRDIDNIVLCMGLDYTMEGEGFDRPFALPKEQELLIMEAVATGRNVIVILNAGGGVETSKWDNEIKGLLMAWYPGQEGGKAIAEILTGRISPSGKLPISIESKWSDNPVYNSYYDKRNIPHKRVQYMEGVFVGYRGYDRTGIKPRYPFGYGLSYSEFEYSNLTVEKVDGQTVNVSFDIKNIGNFNTFETAQVYVCDVKSSVLRPSKELKGFEKVYLKKGEKKRLSITLDRHAFSFFDIECNKFIVESGKFKILVGGSSCNLPLHEYVTF